MKSLVFFALAVIVFGVCDGQFRDNVEKSLTQITYDQCMMKKIIDDFGGNQTVDAATEFIENICNDRTTFAKCVDEFIKKEAHDDETDVAVLGTSKLNDMIEELCAGSDHAIGVNYVLGARGCYADAVLSDGFKTCIKNLSESMYAKLDNYQVSPNILDQLPTCESADEAITCIERVAKGCNTEALKGLRLYFKAIWICEDNGTIQ